MILLFLRNGEQKTCNNSSCKGDIMQIIQKKIDELIPYENNTKKHDDTQIRNVAESIKQYGFQRVTFPTL